MTENHGEDGATSLDPPVRAGHGEGRSGGRGRGQFGGLVGALAIGTVAVGALAGTPRVFGRLADFDASELEEVRLDDEARIELALTRLEGPKGFGPGELVALHAALSEHVGGDDTVLVRPAPPRRRRAAVVEVGVLAFPAEFGAFAFVAPERLDADPPTDQAFVLDLGPLPESTFAPWFELVAERPSWRLWRGRSPGR